MRKVVECEKDQYASSTDHLNFLFFFYKKSTTSLSLCVKNKSTLNTCNSLHIYIKIKKKSTHLRMGLKFVSKCYAFIIFFLFHEKTCPLGTTTPESNFDFYLFFPCRRNKIYILSRSSCPYIFHNYYCLFFFSILLSCITYFISPFNFFFLH